MLVKKNKLRLKAFFNASIQAYVDSFCFSGNKSKGGLKKKKLPAQKQKTLEQQELPQPLGKLFWLDLLS